MRQKSIEFHAIVMFFRNFYFHIRERSGDFLCQYRHHGIFRMEMTAIKYINMLIIRLNPDIMLDIARYISLTVLCNSFTEH